MKNPERYRYSGHMVYVSGKPTEVLDPTKVLRLFGGKGAYKRFVLDGLGKGHKEEYYEVQDQRFLGPEGFGDSIQETLGTGRKPAIKKSIGSAVKELARELDIGIESLRSPDRSWSVSKARTIVAYVLTRRLGYKLGEVAAYLGRDTATVATLVSRLSERMEFESQLPRKIDRLFKIVES